MLHHSLIRSLLTSHDHCRDDGKLISSMIEITGYPAALKEIAPPTPLPPDETNH
jgi:hypothetical protein